MYTETCFEDIYKLLNPSYHLQLLYLSICRSDLSTQRFNCGKNEQNFNHRVNLVFLIKN